MAEWEHLGTSQTWRTRDLDDTWMLVSNFSMGFFPFPSHYSTFPLKWVTRSLALTKYHLYSSCHKKAVSLNVPQGCWLAWLMSDIPGTCRSNNTEVTTLASHKTSCQPVPNLGISSPAHVPPTAPLLPRVKQEWATFQGKPKVPSWDMGQLLIVGCVLIYNGEHDGLIAKNQVESSLCSLVGLQRQEGVSTLAFSTRRASKEAEVCLWTYW